MIDSPLVIWRNRFCYVKDGVLHCSRAGNANDFDYSKIGPGAPFAGKFGSGKILCSVLSIKPLDHERLKIVCEDGHYLMIGDPAENGRVVKLDREERTV
jgi:hypothetical protein